MKEENAIFLIFLVFVQDKSNKKKVVLKNQNKILLETKQTNEHFEKQKALLFPKSLKCCCFLDSSGQFQTKKT
jgi:hypothetical protein